MEEVTENSFKPVPPYASFGKRFYAFLIDQSVIQGAALAIAYPIGIHKWGDQPNSIETIIQVLTEMMPIIMALELGIGVIYGTILEGSAKGATWGKRYCDLRVVTEAGERVSYFSAFLRNIGINLINVLMGIDLLVFLVSLPLYLTPLISKKRQTFYDLAIKAVVVRTK